MVCSLIFLVLCSHKIFEYRLISFSIGIQLYFLTICVFQFSLPGSCEDLRFFLKKKLVRFQSFALTVFWCSTSKTVRIVFWLTLMGPVISRACLCPSGCMKSVSLQCIYTFCLFAFSSLAVPDGALIYPFDYFCKSISPFLKICVNCLLRFYFVYCNNCVLNDVNGVW